MPSRRRPHIPRSQPAYKLPGAAAFSGVHELKNGVLFLRLFKRYPQLVEDLVAKTSIRHAKGDKRDPGSWALLYLTFLLAEGMDIQPWYSDVKESPIWGECGFERTMGYSTVYLRFTELEHPRYVAAFEEAARKLITLAIEKEPRLCRHLSTDGTRFRTSARLEHCCINTVRCRDLGGTHPRYLKRPSGEEVRKAHDKQNDSPETEVDDKPANGLTRIPDERAEAAGLDTINYSYWMQSGHLYRSRDKTAGARMYSRGKRSKRFNFGGVCQPMTDTTTGLPVALHFFPADHNEHIEYPELYRQAVRNMGGREPAAVVADRGLSFKSMFEFHTRKGVGLIVPDRNPAPGQTYENLRSDTVDEDGMPRCPACGGETTWRGPGLGFAISGIGNPYIRVRCLHEHTEKCRGVKRVYCREEWRLLRPIGKLDPLHHELLHVQKNKENLFDILRDRFNVAGDEKASCPRRPGLAMQKLMGTAAMLIDWFRFCILQGYLPSELARPGTLEERDSRADRALDKLRRIRRGKGLNLPYGPAAEKLRLAAEGPWAPDPPPDERPF